MKCSKCNGAGMIHDYEQDYHYSCDKCNGLGVIEETAKAMFEELGYEYYEEDNCIECIMSACIPNRINTEEISFIKIKFYDKHIYIESYETDAYLSNRKNYDITSFSICELKAINKQVSELGWYE